MEYRVFDKKRKRFVSEDVLMDTNGDLYKVGKTLFADKLTLLHKNRYVFQKSIDLYDKNNNLIFVGDCLEAQVDENKIVRGIVTYAPELSSYIILVDDTSEYFLLGQSVSGLIKIIGNVFDEPKSE